MSSRRGIVMLLIALIAGVAAVVLAARWMQQQNRRGGQIAIAQIDIQLGDRIAPEMIKLVEWPSGSIPDGAFSDPKLLDGRVAKTNLQRGEPVLESKLAPVGTKGGLSAVVGDGKRAMTVRVNDVIGVAGFALPGNFVDILVNTQEEGAKASDKDRAISKIVLERILVLAVAQEANRDDTKPKVVNAVTLELTPEQAEKLDLARSVGTLSLVLRNQIDPNPTGTAGATKETLLGLERAPKPAPAPVPVSTKPVSPKPVVRKPTVVEVVVAPPAPRSTECVEVIRGGTKVTDCF
jgi:pilus assembly protein CpaB